MPLLKMKATSAPSVSLLNNFSGKLFQSDILDAAVAPHF